MQLGIDRLLSDYRHLLTGKRVGVLAHAASFLGSGEHVVDRLGRDPDWQITALFGPEHGIASRAQDMEAVAFHQDPTSGIPVYSLYGDTEASLSPTPEMLEGIDVLVIDLQDIGSRYYTYAWTAVLCVAACAVAGKPVILCDRPNPISGECVEGPGIDAGFESFVGMASIPVRHGMTVGEIVQMMNDGDEMQADLTVLKMEGWKRSMHWGDTGLTWHHPSPNMRSFEAALLYPGMCLLEGTNLSEGRGTETPFEIVGAPFIDSEELIAAFEALELPGIHAAPTSFIPTRQKWMHKVCHGVRWVIADRDRVKPYLTGLCFLWLLHKLYGDRGFAWRLEPYEFIRDIPAIDLLTGSAHFRTSIAACSVKDLHAFASTPAEMLKSRKEWLLYE